MHYKKVAVLWASYFQAPSERELARLAVTEGECVHDKIFAKFSVAQVPSYFSIGMI